MSYLDTNLDSQQFHGGLPTPSGMHTPASLGLDTVLSQTCAPPPLRLCCKDEETGDMMESGHSSSMVGSEGLWEMTPLSLFSVLGLTLVNSIYRENNSDGTSVMTVHLTS